ncbi:hypothetical protein B0T22DRAFT_461749 [Podospora appendiculata]|uniref:Secreted protein n=1 Tax=Podospora appendiculata TaxID=314037 RepID=A0AAE0XBF0_9PEZI|nr:hypothetical protein B0T22DRAFT_461749 [Podospora appendiculata]
MLLLLLLISWPRGVATAAVAGESCIASTRGRLPGYRHRGGRLLLAAALDRREGACRWFSRRLSAAISGRGLVRVTSRRK